MSVDDEYKKKNALLNVNADEETESGESGEGGQGGQGTQVAFRDFTGMVDHLRDDLLPDEKKRLLWVHGEINQASIKKQKEKREQYKALKEGKVTLAAHRQGMKEAGSDFKNHPLLADKAQFSGVDRQVNALPTENAADTNDAPRNELAEEYRLRFRPEAAPKFNPKPQYR